MLQHWASKDVFYIGVFYIGSFVLFQFIETVTCARCAFIFALRNIALDGYLDTRRNIYVTTYSLIYIYIYMYIYSEHSGN